MRLSHRAGARGARAAAVLCAAVLAFSASGTAEPPGSVARFDDEGRLRQPEDDAWREWVHIGTPLTPNSLNPPVAHFPEFHHVYIDPRAFAHYRESGEFRDGTVLIKELVGVGATEAVSGKGFFPGGFGGLEVAVKDSRRFADEPGGWAYFSFGHEPPPYPETAEQLTTGACNLCHEAAAARDWVFTQYYPVLRALTDPPEERQEDEPEAAGSGD